jgi:SAM-dependent methyltransferase
LTVAELATENAAHWANHQVQVFADDVTAEQSLDAIEQRFAAYPGAKELLPCDHQGDVLDYGCGPGHDTIAFLLNGAHHVYAADVSWYGLSMLRDRLHVHGLLDRCTLMLVPESGDWTPPPVDHVMCAGVLHHVSDPAAALERMRRALRPDGEIRLMVYEADSHLYREVCGNDPEEFRRICDNGAPIAKAWTQRQVADLAKAAGLRATWLGSYGHKSDAIYAGSSSVYTLVAA